MNLSHLPEKSLAQQQLYQTTGSVECPVNLNDFCSEKILSPREENELLGTVQNDHSKMILIMKARSESLYKGHHIYLTQPTHEFLAHLTEIMD